jgi:hypothetical protein
VKTRCCSREKNCEALRCFNVRQYLATDGCVMLEANSGRGVVSGPRTTGENRKSLLVLPDSSMSTRMSASCSRPETLRRFPIFPPLGSGIYLILISVVLGRRNEPNSILLSFFLHQRLRAGRIRWLISRASPRSTFVLFPGPADPAKLRAIVSVAS